MNDKIRLNRNCPECEGTEDTCLYKRTGRVVGFTTTVCDKNMEILSYSKNNNNDTKKSK